MFSPDTQYPPNTYSVSETCLHHTLLITFSGTLSVIGVDMKPGSTQLHLIPNLEEVRKGNQMTVGFLFFLTCLLLTQFCV